jgi:uracil-DNA glycosylase
VALGRIAHDAVLDAVGLARSSCRFGHGAEHRIVPSRPSMSAFSLVDSYHCSRYNTQTRRLTPTMFLEVLGRAQALVGTSGPSSAVR